MIDSTSEPTFIISYHHEGKIYSFPIHAKDWQDAQQRLGSIKTNAEIYGQMKESKDGH
jgi:hypothetical protein